MDTSGSSSEFDLRDLRGLVATVVLTGHVEDTFAQALSDMRSWCDRNGFVNVEWRRFPAQLVEAGRDAVLSHALNPRGDGSEAAYDWVLQVDADAAPIPPDALVRILTDAYVLAPDADAVGAYCQLKHPPYLPTIDTGTGTWEPIFPGEGLVPVIRTGGHFLLIKTPVLQRFGPPWFRTRQTQRPLDALAEVDNYARVKLHGKNPLADTDEWDKLRTEAMREAGGVSSAVGEDSGFCDAVKAAGGNIYVDTNLVIGHVSKKIIMPQDLRDEVRRRSRGLGLVCGHYD